MTSDTICTQAWKIHVTRKKTQGWLFSGKVQICGHTAWFVLLYHVDIHARFHYWLDRFQLTEHDLAPSSAISYSDAQKSRTVCLVFFFFFLVFFPAKLLHESHKTCVHKERQKKKGSSVLQLETVACSCCAVLCCVQRKSSLLSRHNNKPACQSRERYLVICPQPLVSLIHSKWSKLRQYVHTRSEIVFGNF